MSREGNGGSPSSAPLIWLVAILAVGAGLRSYRLGWGLPDFVFFDNLAYFDWPASRLLARGDWVPTQFVHPPAVSYLLAALAWVSSTLSGNETLATNFAALDLIGRVSSVVTSTLAVAVLYLIGRRLLGTRIALLGAAAFALNPVQVLEAHRPQADTPMVLLALLAAHQAITARDESRRGRLWLAFALSGLAAGVKYTGLASGSVPAWIALTWRDATARTRIVLLAIGGLATLTALLVAIAPMLAAWEALRSGVETIAHVGLFMGQPGQDLRGEGWIYVPYVYPLLVGLPYLMGWTVYLAGLCGLALLVSERSARGPIFAAVLPFFLIQGAAETVVPRYLLPLAPFLCLTAGLAIDRAWKRSRTLGIAAAVAVLGYAGLLAGSQALRIQSTPSAEVAKALREQIRIAEREKRKLVVAYPTLGSVPYDPLAPILRKPRKLTLAGFPATWGRRRAPAQSIEEYQAWLDREQIDAILLTSREEGIARREGRPRELAFLAALEDGRLGFRLAQESSTRFVTQRLYTWADPSLDTHLTAGLMGHKLFVRIEE